MALDNAQFIAELSITDPPGSDPLSQGDDQIRTIKRATFQSFPLVAAAVNLTDNQLNAVAIKNEANVFTALQTIQDNDLILNAAADAGISYAYQRGGLDRWRFTMVQDSSNNDLALTRFDVLGAFVDLPWTMDFLTGVMAFTKVPTINGDPIWTAGEIKMLVQGAALPSTNWFLANGTNGTVDLRDRILGAQGVFTGTQTPFLDANTTVGPITGSTAISAAQMPVHHHRIWSGGQSGITDTTFGHAATDTVVGANRGNTARIYATNNQVGQQIIEDSGSGSGHTHTIPSLNVETAGLDAFQVMPFTYFMQVIQYVP